METPISKVCGTCKQDRPITEFVWKSKARSLRQSSCKSCQAEYRRQHYLDNKSAYLAKAKRWCDANVEWWKEYKKQFKCSRCPEDDPVCIDFHHQDDNKEGNIGHMIRERSREAVIREVAKCIPLCSNCHRKLHAAEAAT